MSILSDSDILTLQEKEKVITPFSEKYLQPSSYDLHFDVRKKVIVPPLCDNKSLKTNFSRIVLPPWEVVLVSTKEKVKIPNGYVGRVEGVSSLGRIGLIVHITAGFIDPNFKGHITLELVNMNRYPIILNDDCKIAQIVFEKLESPNFQEYDEKRNHYQNQTDTMPSRHETTFTGSSYFIRR